MTEPGHPYEILDVFTDTPLQGNPLAVFTEAEHIPSRLMQAAARELHLSETVFLLPGDHECDARLRIFTPTTELRFAGHPVLGAAFVLGDRTRREVRLQTSSGLVSVRLCRDEDGHVVAGAMEQPVPSVAPFDQPDAALSALGVESSLLPVEVYDNGVRHVIVMLDDPGAVAALAPDQRALQLLGEYGFSCFARTEDGVKTRMFGAGLGVQEDPATGSAAGPLALHLARHERIRFGETIELIQGVEIGRSSRLYARAEGTADNVERVIVAGSAVHVAHGHFRLQ